MSLHLVKMIIDIEVLADLDRHAVLPTIRKELVEMAERARESACDSIKDMSGEYHYASGEVVKLSFSGLVTGPEQVLIKSFYAPDGDPTVIKE